MGKVLKMENKTLLNTKEVAGLLNINEKMVYSMVSGKGLPATKVTGKWLFPKHLVLRWIENKTINFPKEANPLPPYHGLLIVCGSNDLLLDKTLSLFNREYPGHAAVFGNMGSLGGIRALGRNLCHIASSHLLQEDEKDYNFGYAGAELGRLPAVVNFCRREQGLYVSKENPKKIRGVEDLARDGIRIANRPMGTGTRLLLDGELKKKGMKGEGVDGYHMEFPRHLDVGLEVLSGRADAGPGIRAVAGLLGLGFLPIRRERFDLIISKDRFFDRGIQLFLGLLRQPAFRETVRDLQGYDLAHTGEMVFPRNGQAV
jgi:excisionase family DNA binding protein